MVDDKTQSSNLHSSSNGLHPASSDLPAGIREGNAGLLSLKDLEAQLGDGSPGFYGRLRRFADVPGIGELLGAVNVPGAKGVRYEPRSAEIFRRLLAASTANEVTPATAVAWLKVHQGDQPQASETAIAESRGIADKTQTGNSSEMTTRGLAAIFSPMVSIMQEVRDLLHDFRSGKAQIAPPAVPPPDRLLTAEEAAALLACNPRSVNRYVKEVLPRKWKESDVLRYIESLTPATKDATK